MCLGIWEVKENNEKDFVYSGGKQSLTTDGITLGLWFRQYSFIFHVFDCYKDGGFYANSKGQRWGCNCGSKCAHCIIGIGYTDRQL